MQVLFFNFFDVDNFHGERLMLFELLYAPRVHLTIAHLSDSVVFMSTDSSPHDTPAVNPEAPVVHASPPSLLLQRRIVLLFLLLAVLVAAIIITVILFTSSQPQKTTQSTTPVSQTPPVNLKTGYQNPFDKSAQYVNPFENLQ